MKLILKFDKTSLHIVIENKNEEIVQLLLSQKEIDVNAKSILNDFINIIIINLFQFHSLLHVFIKLKSNCFNHIYKYTCIKFQIHYILIEFEIIFYSIKIK